MNDLVAQCGGYLKLSVVEWGAGVQCRHGRHVTDRTTKILKQLSTSHTIRTVRLVQIARRGLGRTHKIGERFDVVSVVLRIRYLVESSHGVSVGSIFGWLQWAGDSHFIEIGVRRERNQAGVLILPSEPANSTTVTCFVDRNADRRATDPAAALRRLTARDVQ